MDMILKVCRQSGESAGSLEDSQAADIVVSVQRLSLAGTFSTLEHFDKNMKNIKQFRSVLLKERFKGEKQRSIDRGQQGCGWQTVSRVASMMLLDSNRGLSFTFVSGIFPPCNLHVQMAGRLAHLQRG